MPQKEAKNRLSRALHGTQAGLNALLLRETGPAPPLLGIFLSLGHVGHVVLPWEEEGASISEEQANLGHTHTHTLPSVSRALVTLCGSPWLPRVAAFHGHRDRGDHPPITPLRRVSEFFQLPRKIGPPARQPTEG